MCTYIQCSNLYHRRGYPFNLIYKADVQGPCLQENPFQKKKLIAVFTLEN